jgi:hypothetical protein
MYNVMLLSHTDVYLPFVLDLATYLKFNVEQSLTNFLPQVKFYYLLSSILNFIVLKYIL